MQVFFFVRMAAGCAKAAACGAGTVTAGDGPVDRASRRGRATTAMDLRKLILALALLGAFLPFAKTLHASYQVQRQQLIDSTLESNLAYATKLAKSTDDFVQSAQLQLDYTAQLLAGQMDDADRLDKEAARLRLMSKSFNSIVIFDDAGKVLATSPETLQLQGKTLASAAVRESIRSRQPLISESRICRQPAISSCSWSARSATRAAASSARSVAPSTCRRRTSWTGCWAGTSTAMVPTCTWSMASGGSSTTPIRIGSARW